MRYVFDSKGEPMYLEGFVEDITDRKRMEEELKESKIFLDNMSDVAYITDDQGNLLWVNRAAEQLTGMPREQIINKPFLPLFVEEEQASLVDAYQRTLKGETLEHVSTLKTWITCHFTSLPKYDKQGDIIGTFGVVRDITERLKNEKERLEMEKRIQQVEKAESLSRMAGAVAHHFNNMLFATIGNLEMAREEVARGTDVADNLANAEEAANKAAEMSRFMLTYLGQESRYFRPIDFSSVCSQYLELLQEELPEKIKLYSHIPFSGLIIKGDQEQIQQILKAIIANSVESVEDQKDCSINVSIEKAEPEKIHGETCFPENWRPSADEYVLLKISDTGKGIDEKARELIFDPFYTDKFIGRGLGLAMVLGIVRAHGGCITVESTVGKGTTLRVFLPQSGTSGLDA
ncbi:MAG: two-component system sensor histidine kinase NtrB [Thermodesulfobacteriota bacterium]